MEKKDLDKIRESRLEGLTDEADFYLNRFYLTGRFSVEQIKAAEELCSMLRWFGEVGVQWAEALDEIIEKSIKLIQNEKGHDKNIRSSL